MKRMLTLGALVLLAGLTGCRGEAQAPASPRAAPLAADAATLLLVHLAGLT